jgi:hypothetical protein
MEYKSQQLDQTESYSSSPIRHARPHPSIHWVEVLRKPKSPTRQQNSTSPDKKLGMQGDRYVPWKNHINPEVGKSHVKEFIRFSAQFQKILSEKKSTARGRSAEGSRDPAQENSWTSPGMSPIKQNTSMSYASGPMMSPLRSALKSKVRNSAQSKDISSKMQYLQKKFHNLTNEEEPKPLEKSLRFSECLILTDRAKTTPRTEDSPFSVTSRSKDTKCTNTSRYKDLSTEITQDDSFDAMSQRSPILKRSLTTNSALENEIKDLKKRLDESERANKEILSLLDRYLPNLLESKCAKS